MLWSSCLRLKFTGYFVYLFVNIILFIFYLAFMCQKGAANMVKISSVMKCFGLFCLMIMMTSSSSFGGTIFSAHSRFSDVPLSADMADDHGEDMTPLAIDYMSDAKKPLTDEFRFHSDLHTLKTILDRRTPDVNPNIIFDTKSVSDAVKPLTSNIDVTYETSVTLEELPLDVVGHILSFSSAGALVVKKDFTRPIEAETEINAESMGIREGFGLFGVNISYFMPRWERFAKKLLKGRENAPSWDDHFQAWKGIKSRTERKLALLFGPANYENLPRFPDNFDPIGQSGGIDMVDATDMTAAIMRGTDKLGRHYISVLLEHSQSGSGSRNVVTLYAFFPGEKSYRWTMGAHQYYITRILHGGLYSYSSGGYWSGSDYETNRVIQNLNRLLENEPLHFENSSWRNPPDVLDVLYTRKDITCEEDEISVSRSHYKLGEVDLSSDL